MNDMIIKLTGISILNFKKTRFGEEKVFPKHEQGKKKQIDKKKQKKLASKQISSRFQITTFRTCISSSPFP